MQLMRVRDQLMEDLSVSDMFASRWLVLLGRRGRPDRTRVGGRGPTGRRPARGGQPTQVVPEGRVGTEGIASLHAQPGRFALLQGRANDLGPKAGEGAGQRPLGANDAGQGDEQLGHVIGESEAAGHRLAGVEVNQPRLVALVHHHTPTSEVVVGDAVGVQQTDLAPQLGQQLVVKLFGWQLSQGRPRDVLHHQQASAVTGGASKQHPRYPHSSRAGQQDHVRLPLHLFGGGTKAPRVARGPPSEPPPGPVGEIPVPALMRDELDEQPLPVGGGGQEPGRARGIRATLGHHLIGLEPAVHQGAADAAG